MHNFEKLGLIRTAFWSSCITQWSRVGTVIVRYTRKSKRHTCERHLGCHTYFLAYFHLFIYPSLNDYFNLFYLFLSLSRSPSRAHTHRKKNRTFRQDANYKERTVHYISPHNPAVVAVYPLRQAHLELSLQVAFDTHFSVLLPEQEEAAFITGRVKDLVTQDSIMPKH